MLRPPEDGPDGGSRLSNIYGGANNTRMASSGLVLNFPHPLDFALGPKKGETGGKHSVGALMRPDCAKALQSALICET